MVLAGATAVTVCRLRPECQLLSLPRPATLRPLHLCPSLSIPQTGPAFWRQSWNSGDASRESQSHRRCPVPGQVSGRAEGSLQACPWELENSKTYTLHPGATTSRERRQGHRGPTCPSHIPTLCLAWAGCWNPSEGGPIPNFVKFTVSSGSYEGDEWSEETNVVLEWGLWRCGGHEVRVVWDPEGSAFLVGQSQERWRILGPCQSCAASGAGGGDVKAGLELNEGAERALESHASSE